MTDTEPKLVNTRKKIQMIQNKLEYWTQLLGFDEFQFERKFEEKKIQYEQLNEDVKRDIVEILERRYIHFDTEYKLVLEQSTII